MRAAPLFNAPVVAVSNSARFGGLVNRNIVMLSYVGRRSGRSFSIPVAYRRAGDEFVIGANMPEAKTWWRNFLGTAAHSRCGSTGPSTPGTGSLSATSRDASPSPFT